MELSSAGEKSARVPDAGRTPKLVGLLLDLDGQLARGRQHKHAGAIARVRPHVVDVHKARQQEPAGLATSCLSYGNQVSAL